MIHLVVAAALAWSPISPEAANPGPDPTICAATGGKVVPVCMGQWPMCVIPYADAGKSCTDKSQCEGECRYEGAAPAKGAVVGACQRDNYPCGCRQTIVDGHIVSGFCAD